MATVVVVLVLLGGLATWALAFSDALAQPRSAWAAAGRSKAAWTLLFLLGGWLAAVYYLAVVRPAMAPATASVAPRSAPQRT